MNDNKSNDAVELLMMDHREAEALFKTYEAQKDNGEIANKHETARKVCAALLIHMALEEDIFYPAARKAKIDDELLNEAEVEHDCARDLIAQLGQLKAEDPMFDAKIKVLSEQIEHHVEEEEKKLFPKAKQSNLDLQKVGEALSHAKEKMAREHGVI